MSGPVVWLPDAWRARDHEERELDNRHLHKKLDHILSGLAVIIEQIQLLREGQTLMEAELQPVADAIANLATEEGEVANAVKAIVDKVNNGQVVVKEDAQSLVDAINGVTESLRSVVSSTQDSSAPEANPLPGPNSASDAPVSSTVPAQPNQPVALTPAGPDTSAAATPVAETANADQSTSLEVPAPADLPPTPAVTDTQTQQEESSPAVGATDGSSSEASPVS